MQPDRLDRLNMAESQLLELFRNTIPENQDAVLVFARAASTHHVGLAPTNVIPFPRPPNT